MTEATIATRPSSFGDARTTTPDLSFAFSESASSRSAPLSRPATLRKIALTPPTSSTSPPPDADAPPSARLHLQVVDLARQPPRFLLQPRDRLGRLRLVGVQRAQQLPQRRAARLVLAHRARAGLRLDAAHARGDAAFLA